MNSVVRIELAYLASLLCVNITIIVSQLFPWQIAIRIHPCRFLNKNV